MSKKVTWLVALAAMFAATSAAPAFAQEKRGEASVLLGWTFSDGVSGNTVLAGNGNTYNRIDPKDSFKWGIDVGVFTSEQVEVGFLFTQQMSKLVAGGSTSTEIGDLKIANYHGYVAYNFFDNGSKARPYFFGGMGATHFPSVPFTKTGGISASTVSETQFSTTWGAGIKMFPHPGVGVRVGAQWTPVYIKSDAAGWWCDPWFGCYLVGDPQYSNQFDITGGISFRF